MKMKISCKLSDLRSLNTFQVHFNPKAMLDKYAITKSKHEVVGEKPFKIELTNTQQSKYGNRFMSNYFMNDKLKKVNYFY